MSHNIHDRFNANNRIIFIFILDEVEEEVEYLEGVGFEGIRRIGGETVEDFKHTVAQALLWIRGYEDWWAFEDVYE